MYNLKSLPRNRRLFAGDQMLYMQVRLHSFFFLVSAFFSVFTFLVGAEEESKAANAIAVTPEARMRATMIFFIAFCLVHQKLRQFSRGGNYFFMNGAQNYSHSKIPHWTLGSRFSGSRFSP